MNRLQIGMPAFGKAGANEAAKQAFSGSEYPLSVTVINKMTIKLSLPEAGIKLSPLASATAVFQSFDRLQRAVSSLEQIAVLNSAKELVIIECEAAEDEEAAAQAQADREAKEKAAAEEKAKAESEAEAERQRIAEEQRKQQQAEGGDTVATVVQDDDEAFIVEVQGVRFEPSRNQVREDGTLTPGGVKAFEEAKAASEKTK